MKTFLHASLFAVLIALTYSSSVSAFVFLMGPDYKKGERPVSAGPVWNGRTVTFYVNTDPSVMGGSIAPPITGAELLQSAQAGVDAWAAACRADLRIVVAGATAGTYSTNDGVNIIQWDNRTTAEGNYYGTSTSTLAAATTVFRGGAEFADCDIVLNGNATTTMKFNPAMGEADLRSVLTHEIGHCLGLDHPIEPPIYTSADPFLTGATMVQTAATGLDPSDPGRRDINQDDRDGIECLYERGKPFRTGVHCNSYSGTNGNGAISGVVVGGPAAIDTGCGANSQGRNANPSIDSGDGCVSSALASSSPRRAAGPSPWRSLGGSTGFLLAVALALASRMARRRTGRFPEMIALGLLLFGIPRPARAYDVEVTYNPRKISPDLWNTFAGMDPQTSAWDRNPSPVNQRSLSEIRAAAFYDPNEWGKWGASLSITLPHSLDTNAKALAASEQSKHTTLAGIRLGSELRCYPAGSDGKIRWFIGGRIGLGFLFGSQSFQSSATAGSVSYRAWSSEIALSTGAEIPMGALALVVEGGYSRFRSSYFASTGNSGTAYPDFPSGTRISTNTPSGSEDVRFSGTGLYAALGVQMTFGPRVPSATPTPEATVPATSIPATSIPATSEVTAPPAPPAAPPAPDPIPEVPTEPNPAEPTPDRPDPVPL